MSLSLGSTTIGSLYLGSTKVGAAYLGNVKVYASATTPVAPFTVRIKFADGFTPTMGDTQTLVSASQNIWDITKSSNTNWYGLFDSHYLNVVKIVAANTAGVTNMNKLFHNATGLTNIPAVFDTSSCTNVNSMFDGCINVESGALALYQQMSTQATPPISHNNTFLNCGSNTTTGAAERAQIPTSWGGTMK